jgi:undecaprenyl-diphosphatase
LLSRQFKSALCHNNSYGIRRSYFLQKEDMNMNLDWTILHWIQDTLVCPALDFLMPKITLLGNGDAVWLLAAAALLITKKYRRYGVLLLVALALGVLTGNLTLKPLIARPRPCWVDESVRLLIPNPTDYSFPSGHTLSSIIGATVLTKANAKFGLAAIPLAALIAFSRLYLYVHYPTDILGAAVLGVAIGLLVCAAGGRVITALTERASPPASAGTLQRRRISPACASAHGWCSPRCGC